MIKQGFSAILKSKLGLSLALSLSSAVLSFGSYAASFSSTTDSNKIGKTNAQTLLIGGDLRLCTSLERDNCQADVEFNSAAYTGPLFDLNKSYTSSIRETLTRLPQYRSEALLTLIDQLESPNWAGKRTGLTPRELRLGLLRVVPHAMEKVTRGQWQLLLDHLETEVVEKRFLQRARNKKVEVSLEHTADDFSVKALRQIKERAKGEKVLVITSGNTDAFADVDWLIETLEQVDLEPYWLPIDAAVIRATHSADSSQLLSEEQRTALCDTLPSIREKEVGRFNRHNLYPNLHKQMLEHCKEPNDSLALIDEADAILLWGQNPHTLSQSLMVGQGIASQYWQRIVQRHNIGELLIVANDGVVPALTGTNRDNAAIITGDSHDALLYGFEYVTNASATYPNPHTTANLLGKIGNHATSFTLGVFDNIMFDTRFSERGNQGRLMSLASLARPNFAIGIDSRTTLLIKEKGNIQEFFVEGEGGVAVFDNRKIKINTLVPVQFGQVVMSYLTEGDMMNIDNNEVSFDFADWKFSSSHYGQSVVQSGQVFKSDNFFKTMYMLCSTGGKTATLKHVELGKGHQINVKKQVRAASVNGSRNVNGKNYRYCSFRGYEIEAKVKL